MKSFAAKIAVAGAVGVLCGPALASGFSIFEHSAEASGQAGAWVARAGDAGANWYNPAALVRQGASFQIGANVITVGGDTTFTVNDALMTALGAPPGTIFEPEDELAFPFHLYYARPVNEKLAWGFGINSPYGLVTAWGFPVSVAAKRSELHAFNLNSNLAFAPNDHWSFAFGVNYLYAKIRELSRDFSQQEFNPLLPPAFGTQEFSGDGDDWGVNVALHHRKDRFGFGLTFRSEMTAHVEGDVVFSDIGNLSPLLQPLLVDAAASLDLELPAQAAIGVAYLGEKTELEFDISWAGWSTFDLLAIDVQSAILPDQLLPQDWDDTIALRLGLAHDVREAHQYRIGVVYDQNPVPDSTLRPAIPDSDRYGVSVGYGRTGAKTDFDFYYMAIWFDDRTVPDSAVDPSVVAGIYESFTNLAGISLSWRFD